MLHPKYTQIFWTQINSQPQLKFGVFLPSLSPHILSLLSKSVILIIESNKSLFLDPPLKIDECDCHKYYECAPNGLWLRCCYPYDLVFNETLQQCQFPYDSSCNENSICHSSTTSIPTTTTAVTTPSTSPTTSEPELECNSLHAKNATCSVGPPAEIAEFANCRYLDKKA